MKNPNISPDELPENIISEVLQRLPLRRDLDGLEELGIRQCKEK